MASQRWAPNLATQGVLTFAYDQRGLGATAQRGLWGGEEHLIADLKTLTRLLRERYPAPPCYCSGRAWTARWSWPPRRRQILEADGIVLMVPAVESRDTTHPIQNWMLKVATHMFTSWPKAAPECGYRTTSTCSVPTGPTRSQ